MSTSRVAPVSYIFKIDELRENPETAPPQDVNGQWVPTDAHNANRIVSGGATGIYWLCDGRRIRQLRSDSRSDSNLLGGATLYQTYSMFYCHGRGFQVLRDNATHSRQDEGWFPLSFDHDRQDYSSYLTNARFEPALHCHRSDQVWMNMLLPNIYHDGWEVPAPHGGLKGELGIFLALIAFSIPADSLQQYLPSMFQNSAWQQYNMANGWEHKRGVVVEVWKYSHAGGSSGRDLQHYEEHGKYYP